MQIILGLESTDFKEMLVISMKATQHVLGTLHL